MSSKQNIKETIILLCNIINYHGSTKLTPETLRLAKFNKDEATVPMWSLLFQINCLLNKVLFDSMPCFSAPERKEDLVFNTKHELYMKGYCVRDFFSLPSDMGYGSREILLAFGWLISDGQLLRVLIEHSSSLLQECLPIDEKSATILNLSEKSSTKLSKHVNLSGKPSRHLSENFTKMADDLSSLDTLSWLLGNFRLGCKGLYTAESKLVSLVDKVHCATCRAKCSKGHYSVLEVFLLRHPKELEKFQERLEHYNLYLESLLKFVEHQTVFWKWLTSVYEAKLLETKHENNFSPRSSRCVVCAGNATKLGEKISKIHSEIQGFLSSSETFYEKACTILQMDKSSEELDLKLSELNEQMSSLSLDKSPELSRYQVQTFPELRQLDLENSDCHTDHVKNPEPSCAKQAISLLKSQLSELDIELMTTKNVHLDILNNLAANMPELVCIPPIESSKYFELKNK